MCVACVDAARGVDVSLVKGNASFPIFFVRMIFSFLRIDLCYR